MTLWEKLQHTEPGRIAAGLGEAVYNDGTTLRKETADAIALARAYLERLAMAELDAQVEPWARELLKRAAE